MNVISGFRSVHSVCLWDEKGAPKVQSALQQDIVDFIRDAQVVCMYFFLTKCTFNTSTKVGYLFTLLVSLFVRRIMSRWHIRTRYILVVIQITLH